MNARRFISVWGRRSWTAVKFVGRGARLVANWIPLTLLSVVAIPVLVWLLRHYGIVRQDRILLVVSLGGLALIGLAAVTVFALAIWLKFRRERPGESLSITAGIPVRTGYRLPALGWLPLIAVDLDWETPDHVEAVARAFGGELHEEITALERAACDHIVRRLTVSDVFGLAKVVLRRVSSSPLKIYPDFGQASQVRPLEQFLAGDLVAHPRGFPVGDLVEMRDYVKGDPLKHVLWKTYARTGRLVVRLPEKAIAPQNQVIAAFIAGAGDEATAGVARAMLENGSLGEEFLFLADGSDGPTPHVAEAVEQIVRSKAARSRGGSALQIFAQNGTAMPSVFFVPHEPGPWLDVVMRFLGTQLGTKKVVMGVDSLSADETPTTWRRWLFRAPRREGGRARQVHDLRHRLRAAGADVLVIDRREGREIV